MNISVKHLVAIDQAMGEGCIVPFNGADYTFGPLTFRDYGRIVASNKSAALRAYFEATDDKPGRNRLRDINVILCRGPKEEDYSLSNPDTIFLKFQLSLRKAHPEITDATIEGMLNDDTFREKMCEVLGVVSEGPYQFTDKKQGDSEDPGNPTKTSTGGSAS